ncbi:uncharacterized protein FIBRA_05766 [Fibroporia radiculosa]|uniref:Uncharacterized protein n=1 Tax=Fibroporia radiculosa TaxID=599839 RepID=J4HY25_9APHY|nr:uncharacterized protein FIBRA_05766 [Fibroporia radiculosa]CCM03622.1 predicted protein [Fibroporia radiculosa]
MAFNAFDADASDLNIFGNTNTFDVNTFSNADALELNTVDNADADRYFRFLLSDVASADFGQQLEDSNYDDSVVHGIQIPPLPLANFVQQPEDHNGAAPYGLQTLSTPTIPSFVPYANQHFSPPPVESLLRNDAHWGPLSSFDPSPAFGIPAQLNVSPVIEAVHNSVDANPNQFVQKPISNVWKVQVAPTVDDAPNVEKLTGWSMIFVQEGTGNLSSMFVPSSPSPCSSPSSPLAYIFDCLPSPDSPPDSPDSCPDSSYSSDTSSTSSSSSIDVTASDGDQSNLKALFPYLNESEGKLMRKIRRFSRPRSVTSRYGLIPEYG